MESTAQIDLGPPLPGRGGARRPVRDDPMVGRVVDGRYRIEARIARGGMATVYLAIDGRLDRVVALKVMHAALAEDDAFVSRFQREARSAARLSHPHVVAVFDQGRDGDLVYLAMEYVEGRTLRDVLRERGRLSSAQALRVIDPVLQAVDAAHRAGFVHRDIKPENILLGDDGTVKVADFGLARAISTGTSTVTQGVLIGTVAYLSPEQVERGVADHRSDLYSSGIVLYEMLTGAVPFAGETPLSVAYQHVNATVPRPSSIRADIAPAVDEVVVRATQRDPDRRYDGAPAMLAAVREAQHTLPAPAPFDVDLSDSSTRTLVVEVPTGPVSNSAPQGTRRRRGPLALVLIVLVAAAVGAAGWWWGSARLVEVPAVVGQTLAQAKTTFASTDLTLQADQKAYSETVSAGRIITTDPLPGASTPTGGTVVATVSLGRERHQVPAVAGASVQDATTAITDASLTVGRTTKAWSDQVPQGAVVTTSPVAGTSLKRDQPVDLVVSKGPRPVTVPKVAGKDADSVAQGLTRLGLKVTSTRQVSESVPAGRVISSTPTAGAAVAPGTTVRLVVSDGPPFVDVPSVFRDAEADAKAKLVAAGLQVRVSYPLGFTPFGLVARQSAVGKGALRKGDTVVISVV